MARKKTTRRGRNEGSITKRPNNTYMAQLVVGTKDDGGPDRVTKYFADPQAAKDWLAEQRVLVGRGLDAHPAQQSFGELAEAWMKTQKATVAGNTYEKYVYNYRHLEKLKPLAPKIVKDRLQAHLNELAGKLSPSTLRGVYYIARSVLEEAYEKDLILRMPKIKLPKLEERAPRILETEQINFLVDASKTSKYHYGLWLELGTGLRRGMMLALDWDDFNFKDNTVTANNRMVRENGGWLIKPGAKTKAGARVYDVPPVVMASLMKLAKPGKPMFETDTGSRLSLWNWSRLFRSWRLHADQAIELENEKRQALNEHQADSTLPLVKKIGDVRFHDLRHQFASFLKELGVHIFTIQDMGGWSDPDMARRYSHSDRDQTRAASEKLDAVISPFLQ